jgi:hypothetical protein
LTPKAVVLAWVTYDERVGGKFRPVVVIQSSAGDVLVVRCTSKSTGERYRIADALRVGLPRATWFRPRTLVLPRHACVEFLGRITDRDFQRALSAIRRVDHFGML